MYDHVPLARVIMADRIREANHQHLVRELKRRARPSTAPSAAEEPQRPSRRWTLVHFHRAYN